jgi:HEAT repeat protein
MWLPDSKQIAFFRAELAQVRQPLTAALRSANPDVRQRAAYVVEQVGPDAQILGPEILERLQTEPERLVRMYLYQAMGAIGYDEARGIKLLDERFKSLREDNEPPTLDGEYADVDEKITVAATLCRIDNSDNRKAYLDFILLWLRPIDSESTNTEIAGTWERRWHVVQVLERMPNAREAKPLLEEILKDSNKPAWVSTRVPEVFGSLR